MKFTSLMCALAAGMAMSAAASAEPGAKQAGEGSVLLQQPAALEMQAMPKVVRYWKYNLATGTCELLDGPPAAQPSVRGPVPSPDPVPVWQADGVLGHWQVLNTAYANAEIQDGGILCGEVGVVSHVVSQLYFAYVTNTVVADPENSPLGFTLAVYWDYPVCAAGPNGGTADWGPAPCVSPTSEVLPIGGLPGSVSGQLEGNFLFIDLTPEENGGTDFRFTVPAGPFGYSFSQWVGGWSVNTGPVIAPNNQLLAPGAEDNFHVWEGGFSQIEPMQNFTFTGAFGQFYFEVHAEAACPAPVVGACCVTPDSIGCQLLSEGDCIAAGGTFAGVGVACSVNFCVPPPANDDCLNAIALPSEFSLFIPYDNAGATQDGPDDCDTPFGTNGVDNDVWFTWVAPCSGIARIATCTLTGTDDKLVVYQGTNCGDLNTIVACDDDGCSVDENNPTAPFDSAAEFPITQGTSYLIRIGNYIGAPGQDNFSGFSLQPVGECTIVDPPEFCDADWCQDGSVSVADIFCFLNDWFGDLNGAREYGGAPGVPAIFAFLAEWFATPAGECP